MKTHNHAAESVASDAVQKLDGWKYQPRNAASFGTAALETDIFMGILVKTNLWEYFLTLLAKY